MGEPNGMVEPTPEFELQPFLRSTPGCALLLVACAVIVFLFSVIQRSDGAYEIATFDCGKDRSIVLLMDQNCDVSQEIYYEVRIARKRIGPNWPVHWVPCGFANGNVMLDIQFAADGDVVGIFEVSATGNPYWFAHDFRDGASVKISRREFQNLLRNESTLKPVNN